MQEELEREGIWDFDRLSRPYIRQDFLQVIKFSCGGLAHYLLSQLLSIPKSYVPYEFFSFVGVVFFQ